MKKTIFAPIAASLMLSLMPIDMQAVKPNGSFNIIPLPREVSAPVSADGFVLASNVKIKADKGLAQEAAMLRQMLGEVPGIKAEKRPGTIVLQTKLKADSPEAYTVTVTPGKVVIDGASSAGVFYGIQAIRKAAYTAPKGEVAVIPSVTVTDSPRFAYRGAMLDVSRHPANIDEVKNFIDILALHNINKFHWHLTDDQGWRLEIKKYPLLVEKGSRRDSTVIGHNSPRYDNIPVSGYFTQEQAREVVDYAAKRHITVIPEIDLPGHMLGALSAYPHLGCTGGPYTIWSKWGVADQVLCAGNDSTLTFLDDVLNEVMDIFPSEYIHVGGDECPKTQWKKCPKCQKRIADLGIKAEGKHSAEDRLQGVITTHVFETINKRGRRVIGWDEILEGDIPQNTIIMSWRGAEGAIQAVKKGQNAILTPTTHCYLDYYQTSDRAGEPFENIGGYLPVQKVYSLDPLSGMTPEQAKLVLGAQGNLWTEYVKNYRNAQYMVLPRLAAIAEVAWSPADKRDYSDFANRMPDLWKVYDNKGYNYARHMTDVDATVTSDPATRTVTTTLTSIGGSKIYYTTDGTSPVVDGKPAPGATLYEKPIVSDKTMTIKSVGFLDGKPGKVRTDKVEFSLSSFGKVEVSKNTYAKRDLPPMPEVLVDAQVSAPTFSNRKWLGFRNGDGVITVTLPTPAKVSEVTFNNCIDINTWITDIGGYKIEVLPVGSDEWKVVGEESVPDRSADQPLQDLSTHTAKFAPVEASKVRVTMQLAAGLPKWHHDYGGKPLMFVDEIIVR